MKTKKVGMVTASLALLLFVVAQIVPLVTASQTEISPPPASDSGACFQSINRSITQLQPLSSYEAAQLLQAAENSSQYREFAHGGKIPPVSGPPAIVYHTSPNCAGIVIQAYDFSFVSGGKELTIAVDPNNLRVVGSMIVPAVSWG